MEFQDYIQDPSIRKALDALQWKQPTAIQALTFPRFYEQRNLILRAQTGSGKTGAYALPCLDQLDWEENQIQCLILAPTRELANQIKTECEHLGKYKRIKCVSLIGKQPMAFQVQDLHQKCHIAIGTPGRILDHIRQGTLSLKALRWVILDEADEMVNMGFESSVRHILEALPSNLQYCLCSATMSEELTALCDAYLPDYEQIAPQSQLLPPSLSFLAYPLSECEKDEFLWHYLLYQPCASAIIFCNTRAKCEHVYHKFKERYSALTMLHGAMDQSARDHAWAQFQSGAAQFLIASDLAARGLDLVDVDKIIHYELPLEKERFVHRSGRSGRNQALGQVVILLAETQRTLFHELAQYANITIEMGQVEAIWAQPTDESSIARLACERKERTSKGQVFQQEILRLYVHGGKKKKISAKDIVGAICQIDGISGADIGVIQIQEYGSYVEILSGKGEVVLAHLQEMPIKKQRLKVEIAHHQFE